MDTPESDAPTVEAPAAASNRGLRIVPPPPRGSADGRLASTSPTSDAWLTYYAAAERGALAREREQALRTEAARKVARVLTVVVLALAALGYAFLR